MSLLAFLSKSMKEKKKRIEKSDWTMALMSGRIYSEMHYHKSIKASILAFRDREVEGKVRKLSEIHKKALNFYIQKCIMDIEEFSMDMILQKEIARILLWIFLWLK